MFGRLLRAPLLVVLLGSAAPSLAELADNPDEFDCDAGLARWERGWSEAKKEYCCEKEGKGWQGCKAGAAAALAPPNGTEDCWFGELNALSCCDTRKGMGGDPRCWDTTFTFQKCCPAEAEFVATELEKSCWIGEIARARPSCCDIGRGLRGDTKCWNGPFTFQSCCRNEHSFVRNAHKEACWLGGISPAGCCDLRKGLSGDPVCWDNIFRFEMCCPKETVTAKKIIADSCWLGEVNPQLCCDRRKGPQGEAACWGGSYTHETCCTPQVYRKMEVEAIRETCWMGAFDEKTCCDVRKSAKGDPGCWTGEYSFETCCPAQASTVSGFAQQCWKGDIGPQLCCDTRKGARGDLNCWGGIFQFESCCPDQAYAAVLSSRRAKA